MKIRKGFVSNSSSSSFICEVCGEVESGYDASASDVGFSFCENGHSFCQEHVLPISREAAEALVKRIIENPEWVSQDFLDQTTEDQIEEILSISTRDADGNSTFSDYGFDDGIPEEFCPICSLTALSDGDILSYILKEHGSTREFVIEKARKEFGTYDKFAAAIK